MVTLIFPILIFWCCIVWTKWRFRRCLSTGSVWSMWSRSAVISGMSGGTSMWWWPSVWCVTSIMISTWVSMMWCASVRASVIRSGVTSVWFVVAVALISVHVWLGSRSAEPVSVPVMMSRSRPSMVPCIKVMLLVAGCCAWWQYFVWAISCYETILIAIKSSYMWTMACNMSLFLTLETFVIFTGHYIYCRWGQRCDS